MNRWMVFFIGAAMVLASRNPAAAAAGGQMRVENPGRPAAKNAGRIVKLEEVFRIQDDGQKVVFRGPSDLSLGPDGSLFLTDFAEGPRLYRFGPDGKLMFKILKNGQGPRECEHLSGYVFSDDRLRVLSWVPPKVMDFGPDGRFLKGSRVFENVKGLWFLSASAGKIFGIRNEMFSMQAFGEEGVFTVPNTLYEISPDFQTWRKLREFPVRNYIKNRRGMRLDAIAAAAAGTSLYVVHSAEYRIEQIDLPTGRPLRTISRLYDRPKPLKKDTEEETDPELRGSKIPAGLYPHAFDIGGLQAFPDRFWVFTSAFRGGTGEQLIDVFDAEGRYADCFYLQFPADGRNRRDFGSRGVVSGDGFYYLPESDADGLISIAKYRILE